MYKIPIIAKKVACVGQNNNYGSDKCMMYLITCFIILVIHGKN